ncbi:MAG: TIGR02757 family protein [Tannerella sp.]|jgi:uncharacterized protein (TIGR02757 family)|nr:TIGR02757 family protein [Tannerella sp.]
MSVQTIKEMLDEQVARINTPSFADSDPVQFPRRYTRLQDVEIAAFLAATIAWGNRKMILNNAERMFARLGDSPYDFVMNQGYRSLGQANVHRTFFEPDLAYMLHGFRQIYSTHGTLENFLKSLNIAESDVPAWDLTAALRSEMMHANEARHNTKCFPSNSGKSAIKRINLAMRWLVRNDGIVDLGVWTSLKPSQLYIPLDIHVSNTARELGILERKTNDRKAVEELTGRLREFCPEDPVKYDFALFGIGINRELIQK